MGKLNLYYKKGSLFQEMDKNFIFVHSNNSKGNWGKGIALEFSKKFPEAYANHKKIKNKLGMGYVVPDGEFKIGCLITSSGYGKYKDDAKSILINTYISIINMLKNIDDENIYIKSPKINSGLFDIPWKFTEKIIIRACQKTNKNVEWQVWSF